MKAKQFLATLIITLAFFNVSSSQQELDLIMVMMGENRGDGFGKSISAGDFNNDGFSDVVIGAPLYPENEENLGRVYIYFGSKTMIDTADLVLTGETK
ncbi:MAG: FG-GAP repeat protein, partial [bacterium]